MSFRAVLETFEVVDPIDEHAGERVAVEFDQPAAVVAGPHDNVGDDGLHLNRAELQAGLGIELLDFGDHLRQFVSVDPDRLAQCRQIAGRQQRQIVEQRPDLRVVAVLVFQLQRQALGQRPGADTGRIEALQNTEDPIDHSRRSGELAFDIGEVDMQVSRLIDGIDEVLGNEPLGWIGDGERHLLGQVFAQRDVGGRKGFEIGVLDIEGRTALLDLRPLRTRQVGTDLGRRGIGIDVLVLGIEGFGRVGGCRLFQIEPVVGIARFARLANLGGLVFGRRRRVLRGFFDLQKRVSLQLGFDELAELEIGKLKQADGLLQLGCHHQLLALPHFQFCRDRHDLRTPNFERASRSLINAR